MTKTEIRTLAAEGYAPSDILEIMTMDGEEYPDAKWLITVALRLSVGEVADMVEQYGL